MSETGLKDKDGRHIEPGDTILVDDWLTGIVVFANGGWRYDCGKNLMNRNSSYLYGDDGIKNIRVVKRAKICTVRNAGQN